MAQALSRGRLVDIRFQQFWIFQLVGWSVWVLMLVLRDLLFVPPEYLLPRALVFAVSALAAMVLTAGLRLLYRAVWEAAPVLRFIVVLFGSLLAAMLWQPFQNFIALLPFGDTLDFSLTSTRDLFDGLFSSSYPLLLVWSGLYFIIKYYQLFQAEKEKNLRSEALAHQAQLLMLRYQLNPHFLFNTLNAISTLVLSRSTEKANEMLTKLSKFLRYSLDYSPLDKVTLAHELETSRLYLDIEKVRFAERLRLKIDVDERARNALVPSMILQPLIENSIKYAISRSEDGGTISILAIIDGPNLRLEVADDGPGIADSGDAGEPGFSQGVGISNIRNRLREIYGANHQLVFENVPEGGLRVKVVIPYDRKKP